MWVCWWRWSPHCSGWAPGGWSGATCGLLAPVDSGPSVDGPGRVGPAQPRLVARLGGALGFGGRFRPPRESSIPKEGRMNQSAVGIPTEMLGLEIRPLLRRVYLWMTFGVLLTAIVALLTVTTPVLRNLLLNPLVVWGALIGELALVVVLSAAIRRLSPMVAALLFFAYAGLLGFSLSGIF